MRTNACGVTEVASIRTDQKQYDEGHKRIFGEAPKQFCDVCDKRFSFCECPSEEKANEET